MSLSRKEIASITQDTTTFFLYKDQATSKDLIKIFENTPRSIPGFVLLPIIKTISEYKLDILTDEVKYEMLYKVGLGSKNYSYFQQIVDMFQMYHISIPDTVTSKLIDETLTEKLSNTDRDCQIWTIINCLKPKFSKETIEKILATNLLGCQSQMLEYILKQSIADKDFLFILSKKELFSYATKNKPVSARQIVKNALDTKQLDIIAEQSKAHLPLKNVVLFSEDLIEQMIALCLKEHRAELIFDIDNVFDYVTGKKTDLAKKAVHQLFEDKKEQYISSDSKILSYIVKQEPKLLKKLSAQKTPMEKVKKEQTLALLEEMPLPNVDLEFAYIKRNNNADAKFPSKEKLSPETQDYINIITEKEVKNQALLKKLTPRVISALIDCHFNNHADWYKVMEQLLIANPDLDTKFIQQMLNHDKKVAVLIKRHWKGASRKKRFKKFISEKKQAFMNFFGVNQNKR